MLINIFVASQRIAWSPIINKKWLSIITPLEDSLTITYSEVRYQNLGYQNHDDFYAGISKFNNSIVGWHGHTMEGGIIGETEGSFVFSQILNSYLILKLNVSGLCVAQQLSYW